MIFNKFKSLFSQYPLQTFTYFIPAPPERKQGYREKAFDQIIQKLTKMDFELVDIKTQAINNDSRSGMWAIATIKPLTKKASELSVSDFPNEGETIVKADKLDSTEFTQNLAHFPSKDDNLGNKALAQTPTEGIELPRDSSTDDNEYEDKVEGIYYID